jgi:hypothetical protein
MHLPKQKAMKTSIPRQILFTLLLAACSSPVKSPKEATIDSAAATVAEAAPAAPAATPFSKEAVYETIRFTVTSPGLATGNSFTVTPSGLSAVNDPITQEITGLVYDIETADIDGDNAPELLVKTKSGSDENGNAFIYSSNRNKSLSMAHLPDISNDAKQMAGYQGHDEWAFGEGAFVRRFPLYTDGQKTGKMRQLQYRLKPGEAMKQLVLYNTVEY